MISTWHIATRKQQCVKPSAEKSSWSISLSDVQAFISDSVSTGGCANPEATREGIHFPKETGAGSRPNSAKQDKASAASWSSATPRSEHFLSETHTGFRRTIFGPQTALFLVRFWALGTVFVVAQACHLAL